jgi:SAM-dependent methyltransferase
LAGWDLILNENTFETVVCELCGADQSDLIMVAPDRLHDLASEFNVVCCKSCGLIYINPRPVNMQAYYPEDSYAAHSGRESKSHFSAAPLRSLGLRRRREAVLARKQSGRLLDVGCGAGDFMNAMSMVGGWEVQGIEPGPAAAAQARRSYGLDVRVGQLGQVDIPDASFDVVTMWHVLEHVPHPRATLHEVARILRPDGLLVLACPIVDSWEARFFRHFWSGYDVPRHLYTFSRKTLGRLLKECGLGCEQVYGVVAGFNSLRISTAFWFNERLPRIGRVRIARAMTINLAASLLYILARLQEPSRGSSVGVFYATISQEE